MVALVLVLRTYLFPERKHSFSYPPTCTRIPPTPFTTNILPFAIFVVLTAAILTSMRWNPSEVFICISLWLKLLNILIHLLDICISLRTVCLVYLHTFNWTFVLHILDTNPIKRIADRYFSLFSMSSFHSGNGFLCCAKSKILCNPVQQMLPLFY